MDQKEILLTKIVGEIGVLTISSPFKGCYFRNNWQSGGTPTVRLWAYNLYNTRRTAVYYMNIT